MQSHMYHSAPVSPVQPRRAAGSVPFLFGPAHSAEQVVFVGAALSHAALDARPRPRR